MLMLWYIILANIVLFAASLNAFFATDFFKCFRFSCFYMGYGHIACLFEILSCIMHSAFNLSVFLILCSHQFLLMKGLCAHW